MSYGTPYIDIPQLTRKSGGKDSKMSKESISTPSKPAKKYSPTRMEVAKTVIIAMLVTAVASYIVGVKVANKQHTQVEQAVKAASVQTPVKK